MTTLRCEGLRKSFDGVCAMSGVDVELGPRGVTAIIGPNGAGKTTLLNVLMGVIRPDAGRCFAGRAETTRLPPYRIARLGIARTFQDVRLVQHVSVIDNVLLARPSGRGESLFGALFRVGVATEEARSREEADKLLGFVGLERMASNPAAELSYGQQKLLTLACCLATKAQVLLLDEPVAGVSPEMATRILELLSRVRDDGRFIVFVEHDVAAVRRLADRVIVMAEGRIIADGVPDDVLGRREIVEAYIG